MLKKLFLLGIAIALISSAITRPSYAQDSELEKIKKNLPKLLGANNVGKEFWFTIPPCLEEVGGSDNFVKLYITSPVQTQVVVRVPGRNYFETKNTVANDVIVFDISPTVGQVYQRQRQTPYKEEKVYEEFGLNIVADDPIVVYCVVRYRATSDGFLAIPVSSFGKEYIAATYEDMGAMYSPNKYPCFVGITAAYDNTIVKFTLGGNDQTQTGGGMKPGQTKTAALNTGDVWMFSSAGYYADLTGSKVVSSKPVGIVCGNYCTNIPVDNRWCDYTVEMDLPVYTWGTQYYVGKVPNRKYPPLIRVFAKEPGTKIYRDGAQVGFVAKSGGKIEEGYLEMRLVPRSETEEPRSAVISGDKAIGVTLYNTGIQEDGGSAQSDPFVMVQTPIEQYQKEITFCMPGTTSGAKFAYNWMNLIFETENGMVPDHMEFAEVQSGKFVWQQLNSVFSGGGTVFKDQYKGKDYAMKTLTLPQVGVFKIRSETPFAAYSFGYDSYDSYGYPTSAALVDLTKPDTVPPDPKWTEDCGDIFSPDGKNGNAIVTDQPDDDEIRSNLALIVYDSKNSFNYQFDYDDFVPGNDRSTKWRLKVIDKKKDARAIITFSDRRGNDTTITFEYFAAKMDMSPKIIDFGRLKQGESAERSFWVVNRSTTSELEINQTHLKGLSPHFELLGVNLPYIIPAEDSVEFKVRFTANEDGGPFVDSILAGHECDSAYITYVRATVGSPIINVSDIDWGDVTVGESVPQSFIITNSGTADLYITDYDVAQLLSVFDEQIELIDNNNPKIIKPGEEQRYGVIFTPAAQIAYRDTIPFISDAGTNRDNLCILTGRGIKPGLVANSYDWGRVRIHRASDPRIYDTGGEVIRLINTGTQEVTVNGINETHNGNPMGAGMNAFKGLQVLRSGGIKIAPKDTVYYPVTFQPEAVGEYELEITYNNDAQSDTKTTLKGIGIVPQVITEDYYFGMTLAGDVAEMQTKSIVITNESYAWEDDLTITDLTITPAGGIQEDLAGFGGQGFQYDKAALGLPVTLAPGEQLVFDANFVAPAAGNFEARVTTVSDAIEEKTSIWTGDGETQSINGMGGEAFACVGEEVPIDVTIENTGDRVINVEKIYLEPITNDFKLVSTNGFILEGGESRIVQVMFTPQSQNIFNINLAVITDNKAQDTLRIPLLGESVEFARVLSMDPASQNKNIGEQAEIALKLDNIPDDMSTAELEEFILRIYYDNAFIATREELITSSTPDIEISVVEINHSKGLIELNIAATGGKYINEGGELGKVVFNTYLPTAAVDSASIEMEIIISGNQCVTIEPEGAEIILEPICVENLRHVAGVFGTFAVDRIVPNPVGAGGAEVTFQVGKEGWTQISIINSLGELVDMPIADNLTSGEYSFSLPVNKLGSGTYVIELRQDRIVRAQKLIIAK